MPVTTSQLQDAAARVSSTAASFARGPSGSTSSDAAWQDQKGKIARALVADPDLVTYFAYLVSNRACAAAVIAAADLSALVTTIEGWKLPAVAVEEPTKLKNALSTIQGRSTLSAADVARVTAEANAYVQKTLVPQVTKNGRAQVRGSEADALYATQRATLTKDWKLLLAALKAFTDDRQFNQASLRNTALATPMAALSATADLLDASRLTDFALQLAAASASVSAMGRSVELRRRLQVGENEFPGGVSVTQSTLTLTFSVSPKVLGIRSGDVVRRGGAETTVTAVTDTAITVATTLPDGTLQVLSAPYAAWELSVVAVSAAYGALPTDVVAGMRSREGDRSAARVRDLMQYLADLAARLDALSSDASSALERVGGTPLVLDGTTSVSAQLRAFAPTFSSTTRGTGDAILSALESAGFDYVVEQLYAGQVDDVLAQEVQRASRVGRVTSSASALGI